MGAGSAWPGAWHGTAAGADLVAGSIDDVVEPLPVPDARDLLDAGRRRGEQLRLFLRRRGMLRLLVARRLGLPVETVALRYGRDGAPVLRQPAPSARSRPLFVSVAARGSATGFALADAPVGVDLEPLGPPGGIDAALTAAERRSVETAPAAMRPVTTLRYWTAKEAYLKALGTGLLRDPATVEVVPGTEGAFAMCDAGHRAPGRGAWVRPLLGVGPRAMMAVWTVGPGP